MTDLQLCKLYAANQYARDLIST